MTGTDEKDAGPQAGAPVQEALSQVLARCYGRVPNERELFAWADRLKNGLTAEAFLRRLVRAPGFTANRQLKTMSAAGHFYSPVVDPELVVDYVARERLATTKDIAGIEFPLDEMEEFWRVNRDFIAATPFQDRPGGVHRYGYIGGPYNFGDAITLRAMIGAFRPRRVIEIGSGYSTACMLDTADELGLIDFEIVCIEPYPARLKSLLRISDAARVRIIEAGVQATNLEDFRRLERNDILFIDSTHVLKTGSDVHFELFHVLPVLKPGVLIHFHDCRWPLEYPDKLIFDDNRSWNEVYALRALLMYKTRFRVFFYNSLFALECRALVQEVCPVFLKNPGSAIWLKVQEPPAPAGT